MDLYRILDASDLDAPVLIAAFDGWVDAGTAATTAATWLVETGLDDEDDDDADDAIDGEASDEPVDDGRRPAIDGLDALERPERIVARFDGDRLFDFRARRPTLEIHDGRLAELTWPALTVRRSTLGGRDVIVLAGAEPDYRWHEFAAAVVELVERLGVSEWVSLGAIPAAVPHTRPVPILGTASRPGLLPGGVRPGPAGILRVPSAALSVVEMAVAARGLPAVGYFAQIPHYISGDYPAAAIALLRTVGRHLAVDVDLTELEAEAEALGSRLNTAAAVDEATRNYVERLERMVDEERLPAGDELIAEIERFLRDRGGGERERD